MLEKRPYLLRATSSRSLLLPCDDGEGEQTTFCNNAQVTGTNPRLALSAPCKVVIGFDLGAEKKAPSDACESPRSVLDTLALLTPQEKQHAVVARSLRSGLGSLLAATSGSGVGLEVVSQAQGNGASIPMDPALGSFKITVSQICVRDSSSHKISLSSKLGHHLANDTEWIGEKASGKAVSSDLLDADIPALWQRQAPHLLCVEDEHLDADISSRSSQAVFTPSIQDVNANLTAPYFSPYQSRASIAHVENGLKDGCLKMETFPQCSHAPWQAGQPHFVSKNVTNPEHIKAHVPTWWRSGMASHGPGMEGPVNGCKNDHITMWQGEVWSVCEGKCTGTRTSPSQRQSSHYVNVDLECKEVRNQQSIFSAASPPSCSYSLASSFSGFLKECSFCGVSLRLGKDIFMYRGDQAFCSAECRYQEIFLDESTEKHGK